MYSSESVETNYIYDYVYFFFYITHPIVINTFILKSH